MKLTCLAGLLALAALACNLQAKSTGEPAQPGQPGTGSVNVPEPKGDAGLAPDTSLPTPDWQAEQDQDAGVPDPEITLEPALLEQMGRYAPSSLELAPEIGMTRFLPYPTYTTVVLPEWDFQVRQVLRGDAAWQLIRSQSPNSPPAPAGQEYILALVSARCKNWESECPDIALANLFVTGSSHLILNDTLWDIPAPELYYADIYTAEEMEGWSDALLPVGDPNPLLVIDVTSSDAATGEDTRFLRYIALQDGASLAVPAELAAIQPNELGKTRAAPAPRGETVVTGEWQVSIGEVIRGADAAAKIKQVNDNNPDPEAGMEFILCYVRVRRIGGPDAPRALYDSHFYWSDAAGERYFTPTIYGSSDPPNFWARIGLFPGGSAEGWMAAQAPIGQPGVIVFDPDRNESGYQPVNVRYLSVE